MPAQAAKEKNLIGDEPQLAENSRLGFATLSRSLHQGLRQNKPLIALEKSDSLEENRVRFVYAWNARNQLVAISGNVTASFSYDALGRRVSKTINGVRTDYQYDGNDIVAEIGGGAVGASYVRSLRIDEPFARITSSGTEYYHTDALGSVFALTNANGNTTVSYTYDPFGNTTQAGVSSNPFQYTGRENDGTGLYYYRARYYSPALQRFISEDPSGYFGGINFYLYAGSNPVSNIDLFGLVTWPGAGTPSSPSQEFGAPRPGHSHNGLDISNPVGGDVKASDSGTVISVTPAPCNGQCNGNTNQVIIRNDDGSRSGYAHVDPSVQVGDHVNEGDTIGSTDLSGRSTGGHVHYTYRDPGSNSNEDPRDHLPDENNYNNPGGNGHHGSGGGNGGGGFGGRK